MSPVFGEPIIAPPSREERAKEAFDKRKDGRDREALKYLQDQKEAFGNGISTKCMIYNASGEAVFSHTSHNWYGHVYDSIPTTIQNGQWGAFFHVKAAVVPSGSEGAVVYRGKAHTDHKEEIDLLVSWDNPWMAGLNHVYTEINDAGRSDTWENVGKRLEASSSVHSASLKHCSSSVSIEEGTTVLMEATFTLPDVLRA